MYFMLYKVCKVCKACTACTFTYVKGIDNDVIHRKIFTTSKILVFFIFLNMANLLLINTLLLNGVKALFIFAEYFRASSGF